MQRAGTGRALPSDHRAYTTHGYAPFRARHALAIKGRGGAPAAQTPAALGRPPRSAACQEGVVDSLRPAGCKAITARCKAITACFGAIPAGFVLGPQGAACGGVRRRRSAHRYGDAIVDDRAVDSFCWSLVQPLVLRGGGRHLVQWRLLDDESRRQI